MRRRGKTLRSVVIGCVMVAVLMCDRSVWARVKGAGPALWIAADRIVGFVPFTVYLYGKIQGTEPGLIELCRSEAPRLTESPSHRMSREEIGAPIDQGPAAAAGDPACATGKVVRTQAGYDYSHDLRFDRPGTYHVRLSVVDRGGHRAVSNIVQVNAL